MIPYHNNYYYSIMYFTLNKFFEVILETNRSLLDTLFKIFSHMGFEHTIVKNSKTSFVHLIQ